MSSAPPPPPAPAPARPPSPVKKPVSPVWKYVTKGTHENVCNLCSQTWNVATSTSPIAAHLLNKHSIDVKPKDQGLIIDSFPQPPSPQEKEKMTEALIRWIVEDSQAFNVVESPAFREFMALFRPTFQIPRRQFVSSH